MCGIYQLILPIGVTIKRDDCLKIFTQNQKGSQSGDPFLIVLQFLDLEFIVVNYSMVKCDKLF